MNLPIASLGLVILALVMLPGQAAAEALTLKRVMLSTGGLGYFEYETTVEGDAEVNLSVPLDQVDDVLKSLVVYDDKGRIGTVSLPGRQPLAEVFKGLPFDQAALSSPAALLRALAGAEVKVAGPQATQGRILSVVEEQERDADNRVITRTRVTLMGSLGLSQFVLEDAQEIAFADPALQESVAQALTALARHGERDRRVLTLSAPGEGSRQLRVAYVVAVPLWKTSYRLTLPEGTGSGAAGLQGWAVLENQSGENWDEVELSLVSGNPVAFRQALYESYYLDRPEIPVQVVDRIMPPVDRERAYAKQGAGRAQTSEAVGGVVGLMDMAQPTPAAPAAEATEPAAILEAATRESVSQAIYRFPNPVTVEDGHSLLVPFLDRSLPVERVSFFQPGVSGINPLASLRLDNDSGLSFPPGLITLYERGADGRVSYLGDARLALLPSGESRLISFAVDGKVTVETRDSQRQTVTGVSLRDGIMTVSHRDRFSHTYKVIGASDAPRVVLLQEPRRQGWSLVEPGEGVEEVNEGYRLSLALEAGETREVSFVFERPLDQRIYLADASADTLAFYIGARFVPAEMKRELTVLLELKSVLADTQRGLSELEAEEQAIVTDQARLRENLAAVPADSDLGRRYLRQLSEQEDRLESLRAEAKARRQAVEDAAEALRAFIGQLTL